MKLKYKKPKVIFNGKTLKRGEFAAEGASVCTLWHTEKTKDHISVANVCYTDPSHL